MYSYNPYYEKYLAHYGVLGMKWGVRRYQNKDGSLTPKGKERQKKLQKKLDSGGYKAYKKIQSDKIFAVYNNEVVTKDMYKKLEEKRLSAEKYMASKLQNNLERMGFKQSSDKFWSERGYYDKKLKKDCTLSINARNSLPAKIPTKDSIDNFVNRVFRNASYIDKNFDAINKQAAKKAIDQFDDHMIESWLSDTKFENMSRKQLSSYLEKQGPNSISLHDDGDGGTIWYQDGKKNDMEFFSDHSICVEFAFDKDGNLKTTYASMEG